LRNLIVDSARKQSRRPVTAPIERDLPTDDDADAVVGLASLEAALRGLTAEQREVIYHGHIRESPHREIAQLLGVPVGTVRSRLFYARQALKRALVEAAPS
jgi:RNA polymerase sigma-70 factor (ECF subfamily)